eukprot:TRINITY_DN3179_c1_g3_i2.p1 TRINITY_DN3179_c1_g3~~TRINITY_DN3179_c1_g3_i2.p1  ORF type:complete len:405 (+),score=53.75 TRINITY_DN3179_c1_g3_i2:768-1982(+)
MDLNSPRIPDECPFVMQLVEGKGRGAIATRDIAAGEVVLMGVPTSISLTMDEYVLNDENDTEIIPKSIFCGRCLLEHSYQPDGRNYVTCDTCKHFTYCSEECKTAHKVEIHPPEVCSAYKSGDSIRELRDSFNFLVTAHHLRNGKAGTPYNTIPGPVALEDILKLSNDCSVVDETVMMHLQHITDTYLNIFSSDSTAFSRETCLALLTKDLQNSCIAREGAVSCNLPAFSMFNHACYPNVARIDYMHEDNHEALRGQPPSSIIMRALQPIAKGQELTISYAPIGLVEGYTRQEHLEGTYGISCNCDRCMVEDKIQRRQNGEEVTDDSDTEEAKEEWYHSFMKKFHCQQPDCKGTMVPMRVDESGDRTIAGEIGELLPVMECNTCYTVVMDDDFAAFMSEQEQDD